MHSDTVAEHLRRYLVPEGMPHAPKVLELGATEEDSVFVITQSRGNDFRIGLEAHWIEGDFDDEMAFANYLSEVLCGPNGSTREEFRFDDQGVGWMGVVPNWRTPAEP
ncbi:hypothetical protein [Pseudoclavibacter sp. RFBB5]|uniref:hypothetical protein n=1 Tax=Pseudoclavibacter sp. RFBB5 TaxID=2080574 RepID=UPI000CE90B6F|nr:hypothetical protein [Pseudoclavibacter sp. RFBB5]PPG27611.1 hypothetical protein C5B97_15675 [Pseudoclavibacter sp. RFBB5]